MPAFLVDFPQPKSQSPSEFPHNSHKHSSLRDPLLGASIANQCFTKVSALGIEEQRTNVIADFVDAPGPLGDGYRVEARIIIWEAENVLKVPASALFRYGDGWSIFVIEDGRARRREVEIGHRSQFEAEVLNGIEEGAPVIVHPTNQINDGSRVEKR